MRCSFSYGLKEIAAAAVLSFFIAGGVGAVTEPGASESEQSVAVSVDRTNKADRLPQVPSAQRSQHGLPSTEIVPSPKRAPLGCDPVFSPVADPARAHFFKRCTA